MGWDGDGMAMAMEWHGMPMRWRWDGMAMGWDGDGDGMGWASHLIVDEGSDDEDGEASELHEREGLAVPRAGRDRVDCQ